MVARARTRLRTTNISVASRPGPSAKFDAAIAVNVVHVAASAELVLQNLLDSTAGPALVVWPHDNVGMLALAKWERASGRHPALVVRALLLRMAIGVPGMLLRVRTASEADLDQCAVTLAQRTSRRVVFSEIPNTGCVLVVFGSLTRGGHVAE
jgi:hypothetical protein